MSELVTLITAWEDYSSRHPRGSATEFCMHFLARESHPPLFGGLLPPDLDTVFAKLIGRLAGMQTAYSKMALQELPGFELEWFYFLSSIYQLPDVKKTQIIQYNFTEQTTGIDILHKLKKRGYIAERTDPADKRAKLVRITKTGEKILFQIYRLLYKATLLLYHDIDAKDKQVVINILKATEQQHQELLSNSRHKPIDELLADVLGEERVARMELEQKKRIARFAKDRQDRSGS